MNWDGLYYDVYYGELYQGTVNCQRDFNDLMCGIDNCSTLIPSIATGRRIDVDIPAKNIGKYDADQSGGYIVIDTLD